MTYLCKDGKYVFSNLTNGGLFLCVFPAIEHYFLHKIVKVAADPRGYSCMDPRRRLF